MSCCYTGRWVWLQRRTRLSRQWQSSRASRCRTWPRRHCSEGWCPHDQQRCTRRWTSGLYGLRPARHLKVRISQRKYSARGVASIRKSGKGGACRTAGKLLGVQSWRRAGEGIVPRLVLERCTRYRRLNARMTLLAAPPGIMLSGEAANCAPSCVRKDAPVGFSIFAAAADV